MVIVIVEAMSIVEFLNWPSSSVSRVTERELPYLDVNETPGITFVFDYSGLMKLPSKSLFHIILEIVITCGGIISVDYYFDSFKVGCGIFVFCCISVFKKTKIYQCRLSITYKLFCLFK